MRKTSIEITRGSTLSQVGKLRLPAGTWVVTANVEDLKGTSYGTLDCSLEEFLEPDVDGNTHAILIEASSVLTATWPIKTLVSQLKFTDTSSSPAVVQHTSRFNIQVQEEV